MYLTLIAVVLFSLAAIPSWAAENVKDELTKLEKQWAEAGPKGDLIAFFNRIASDDYIIIDETGDIRNKQQELASMRREKITVSTVEALNVRVYGETAVVTGRFAITGSNESQPFSVSGRFTDVWVKQEGQWRVVSTQNSILPQARDATLPPNSFFEAKEKQIWDAIVQKDKDAAAQLLAKDFIGVYQDGFATKQNSLRDLDRSYTLSNYQWQDFRVIPLASKNVLLLYKATCKGSGEWMGFCSHSEYVSSLWEERNGKWMNVFSQDTPANER